MRHAGGLGRDTYPLVPSRRHSPPVQVTMPGPGSAIHMRRIAISYREHARARSSRLRAAPSSIGARYARSILQGYILGRRAITPAQRQRRGARADLQYMPRYYTGRPR